VVVEVVEHLVEVVVEMELLEDLVVVEHLVHLEHLVIHLLQIRLKVMLEVMEQGHNLTLLTMLQVEVVEQPLLELMLVQELEVMVELELLIQF
jgi:hypothetical protein|tara:strand:- start:348 stop:626 length:279 start_codon:yes stop_codon:yes gene_type:complete